MKKIITICIMCTFATTLIAQVKESDPNIKKLEYGFVLGSNFSSFNGETEEYASILSQAMTQATGYDINYNTSARSFLLTFGGSISYNLFPWVSFTSSILYSPKGMKYRGSTYIPGPSISGMPAPGDDLNYELIEKVRYIDIPIVIELNLRKSFNRKTFFYLIFGIAPSVYLSGTAVSSSYTDPISDPGNHQNESESSVKIDYMKSIDFGLIYGGGFRYNILNFSLEFTHGLTDIDTNPWTFKNKTVSFVMGVKINSAKK